MLIGIILDILLVAILLMIIPLGFLRGGLREVCTTSGLLLGILVSINWSDRWASWLSSHVGLGGSTSFFVVSAIVVTLFTAVLGYGATASFSGKPGPGGRMFGALLAFCNGLLFAGFLINAWADGPNGGSYPPAVEHGYFSRALSAGFDWLLLIVSAVVLAAAVFGMFVRERGDEEALAYPPTASPPVRSTSSTEHVPSVTPVESSDAEPEHQRSAPVRIKEVRHWEQAESEARPEQGYGTGWRQTWPAGKSPTSSRRSSAPRSVNPGEPSATNADHQDTLRRWMEDGTS